MIFHGKRPVPDPPIRSSMCDEQEGQGYKVHPLGLTLRGASTGR